MTTLATLRIGRFYDWQGRLVTLREGARVSHVSGYGARDTATVEVVVVDDYFQDGYLDGQSFSAIVSDLEEVEAR